MRVGKKPNVVDSKKTRSCVVRLEKVAKDSTSPISLEDNTIRITRSNRSSISTMGATPKGRRTGVATQQEDKTVRGPVKKRPIGSTSSSGSNLSTPQQQKTSSSNMSNIRSSQKIKVIPRSNKGTPASTPSRDETPPPTIAAGRSRRAIKPNPKYASEDLVTSKVVRNVAALASSTNRGGFSSSVAGDAGKARKSSTSSDDFYNRNSDDDDYENEMNDLDDDDADLHDDKAYQANEKDQDDSDFSEIEVQPVRVARPRGRPRRVQEPTAATPQQTNKLSTPTLSSNIKRAMTTSASTSNSANLRSAPSQLQQIRRSLANANAQRNLNMLAGSSSTAQKRKLEDSHDSSDTESNYTVKRKQLLLSNSTGLKVKDNRINNTSAALVKSRTMGMQKVSSSTSFAHSLHQKQLTINGGNKVNNSQTITRRTIEIGAKTNTELSGKSATSNQNKASSSSSVSTGQQNNNLATQAKMFAAKNTRLRSNSPKPTTFKHSSPGNLQNTLPMGINNKASSASDKLSTSSANLKTKSISSPHTISVDNLNEIKDNSPNSTIDDFETMPTFTIVNVNDIINKKGDVLITKSKTNSSKTPSVIEFTESIDLEDDDEDEEVEEIRVPPPVKTQPALNKRLPKVTTMNSRKEFEHKKSPLARSNESLRKLPTVQANNATSSKQAPQILNHKLGLRNSRVTPKTTTTLTATLSAPDKPAPRILNSVVAKKTQPVKPMIANMDDSADESFPLSLDEDEEDEEEETEDEIESRQKNRMLSGKEKKAPQRQTNRDMDTEDTESQNTEEDDVLLATRDAVKSATNNNALTPKQNTIQQRRKRITAVSNAPLVVSNNKKKMTSATAAKENSLAATNQRIADGSNKQPISTALPRKANAEKVVISKQGDKIIKKITCYETWYVINMPMEPKRPTVMKNQLEMPLIRLANNAKSIGLPTDLWSSKVTLYELSPQTLGKTTNITYTGDLSEHNISEEDRGKYQPSCVMFRRSIEKNQLSRMPYDRAVIFKNKTFYTNIEGKNVRLVGAPSIINCESEIEILLEIVDALTLQSEFVEHISIVQ